MDLVSSSDEPARKVDLIGSSSPCKRRLQEEEEESQGVAASQDSKASLKKRRRLVKDAKPEDVSSSSDGGTSEEPKIATTFQELEVSEATRCGIQSFGFSAMTLVQQKTIPLMKEGKDIRVTAQTGSGKTLAYVIPAIEKIKHDTEVLGCIILSPTRELALQTGAVVAKLAQPHGLRHGVVMGGANIHKERDMLKQGVNILVATPGRLLDHLKHTRAFKVRAVKVLVVDEADRMLDDGFEKEVHQILHKLPKQHRQTTLFSATVTKRLSSMTTLALSQGYVEVNLTADVASVTADNLSQAYLVCPTFQRFLVLYKLLSENKAHKIMVFLNTCDSVNFYKRLLNRMDLEVQGIHGRQGQQVRTSLFSQFAASSRGVMLCTDIAARGWDIPAVNLIVQYDPPSDINEYIHRVGRAARREGEQGTAVLLLRDEELGLVKLLRNKKVALDKFQGVDMYDLDFDVQSKMEAQVTLDPVLKEFAVRSFRNFLISYSVLKPRKVYSNSTIPVTELAKNFGLASPPEFRASRAPLTHAAKNDLRKPKPKTTKTVPGGKSFSISKKLTNLRKKTNQETDEKQLNGKKKDRKKKVKANIKKKFEKNVGDSDSISKSNKEEAEKSIESKSEKSTKNKQSQINATVAKDAKLGTKTVPSKTTYALNKELMNSRRKEKKKMARKAELNKKKGKKERKNKVKANIKTIDTNENDSRSISKSNQENADKAIQVKSQKSTKTKQSQINGTAENSSKQIKRKADNEENTPDHSSIKKIKVQAKTEVLADSLTRKKQTNPKAKLENTAIELTQKKKKEKP